MAKSSQQSKHVNNIIKVGSPRPQKPKHGNSRSKTARSGSGRKVR